MGIITIVKSLKWSPGPPPTSEPWPYSYIELYSVIVLAWVLGLRGREVMEWGTAGLNNSGGGGQAESPGALATVSFHTPVTQLPRKLPPPVSAT